MNNGIRTVITRRLGGLLLALYLGLPASAWSNNLNISDIPLFLGGGVAPNIMFTLDDSGSMYWSFMPDSVYYSYGQERGLAANFNYIAYNPAVTYSPPVNANGVSLGDASFTAAWDDGYAHATGASTCTLNLSTRYRPTWYYGNHCNGYYDYFYEYWDYPIGGQSAYYYVYYTNHPAGAQPRPSGCTAGNESDNDCYIKVTVGSSSGPGGSDERQNFANWYSYYRKRMFLAKAGVGRAFAQQGTGLRVGFGAINNGTQTIDGVSTHTISRGVRAFSGSDRSQFFDLLYNEQPTLSTPLRRAADAVGQYFERTDNEGPWNETPGVASGADLTCRPSYHIIMSDGYWSEGGSYDADTSAARQNTDGTDGPTNTSSTGSSYSYVAQTPFSDGRSDTLADVAMYYWKRDLRSDLVNDVAPNSKDPAFWQHLVTFAVGLGVEGTIDPTTAFNAIDDGTTITWPTPFGSNSGKIDDMLHAAVNGRGGFFSAKNPTEFATALADTLSDINDRTSSAASVVLNSNSLYTGSRLYQAIFKTDDWSGDLRAYNISYSTAAPVQDSSYSPAGSIPAANSRRIVTYDGSHGVTFRWGSLTTAQQTALDAASVGNSSSNILDYLRGDRSNEKPVGSLRKRGSLLGDIINSAPAYINPPNAPYYDNWGQSAPENAAPYSTFRSNNASRSPFIAVGANDGMLHVFDAASGVELYAYVPSMLMSGLPALTVDGYSHNYYVDGSPTVGDAFYGSAWHTVLVGGLNAGGQGVYALDITNRPATSASEGSVISKVLWEFDDSDDSDLGYTFSRPNIVRMANGKWAAVFGNGYNNTVSDGHASSSGNAVLYIVDIQTGALIKKIDTKEGATDDPLGVNRPNGLSTVAPVDVDGDFVIDYIYGGDLFGNMWRFDVSSSNTNQWKVAYGNAGNPLPLFRARKDPADPTTAQPITSRPQITRHPERQDGLLVLFGTGKYFEVGDNNDTGQTTQSVYGIWDREESNLTVFTRDDLLQQEITAETTVNGVDYRVLTNHVLTWYNGNGLPGSGTSLGWYMDLYNTDAGNTDNYGERAVSNPIVRGDRLIFTTLIPSDDPCDYGGTGWLMEI